MDDTAAYQGYETRFYRDSKSNTALMTVVDLDPISTIMTSEVETVRTDTPVSEVVALMTDYVFQDPSKIGLSLAVVQAILCSAGGLAFCLGIPHLRQCVATASQADAERRLEDQVPIEAAAPARFRT